MNVLEIVQEVCYLQNIPAPTALVTATDAATLQLKTILNATGRDLLQAKCWPQLKKTYSFTTSNGVSQYALPTDFYCSIFDTFWDNTNRWKLAGPLTDSRFNELFFGYATFSNRIHFRLFGQHAGASGEKMFVVQPTPGTTNVTVSFDYMSMGWLYLVGGTWSSLLTADTDIPAFDNELLILGMEWRWLQRKGLEYEPIRQEYQQKIEAAQARWQGSRKTSLSANPSILAGLDPNIPEGSFTL